MTRTVLNFPVRDTAALRCVWIETGNPAQPLVCKWVSRKATQDPELKTEAHDRSLCA
jgi:hypothetical protein